MKTPEVTVAICTRDRRDSLERAIASLLLAPVPLACELLVVDSASSDGTAAWLSAALPGLPVPARALREEQPGVARARNRALAEARAPLLLFLDDDSTATPGWLALHAAAFADPGVVATGGRIEPVLPPGVIQWLRPFYLEEDGGPSGRFNFGPTPLDLPARPGGNLPFGANMGLRVTAARALGGFNHDLGWGAPANLPGEETDLMRRLLASGGRLRYLPAALVRHHLEPAALTPAHYLRYYTGIAYLHAQRERLGSDGRRQRSLSTLYYRAGRFTLASRFAALTGRRAEALMLLRRRLFVLAQIRERRAHKSDQLP